MRRLILGTAGHIDHGKTSLVRALTGVDTDRLPEEKRRGITIDLGFAALQLGDVEFGIVDVPGHEALVRNMLAGATGIDIVLLVIAADEGIMPQTREHLAIMQLLQVKQAVVAITKADLVDKEWLELVTADVCDVIAGTRFAGAAAVPLSATTGVGLSALRDALAAAAATVTERTRADVFRMPVDRVFTVHGTGTVVTGTVWSGEVRRDAKLTAMPAGTSVRTRGLQVHGHPHDVAAAGERVALALAIDKTDIRHGDVLVEEGRWESASILTAHVHVLADAEKPLRHRQRVRFHLGTAEILARVAVLQGAEVAPGDDAWIQLRLESPCVARAGDRFVLRSYSPVRTVAGGAIAEPRARKRKRLTDDVAYKLRLLTDPNDGRSATEKLHALLELTGPAGIAAVDLPVLIPAPADEANTAADHLVADGKAVRIGENLVLHSVLADAKAALLDLVGRFHADFPIAAGIPKSALSGIAREFGDAVTDHAVQSLIADRALRPVDGLLALPDFQRTTDPGQSAAAAELSAILTAAGLETPAITDLPEHLRSRKDLLTVLRFLEQQGTAIAISRDRFVDRVAVETLIGRLHQTFTPGQALTTSDLKEAIGLSRKYLIPILEYFDREGVTRREGEDRTWVAPRTRPS